MSLSNQLLQKEGPIKIMFQINFVIGHTGLLLRLKDLRFLVVIQYETERVRFLVAIQHESVHINVRRLEKLISRTNWGAHYSP
jgi:hypothetical protein